ncbi:MAG: hypothetical protein M1503_04655 [Thaumarchaeota archaeon]|nr:hypothetical protein [Nitrososphaerota archaeon]MCL5317541.1 hypothetical protein [Nitrososphaerota archaeon]
MINSNDVRPSTKVVGQFEEIIIAQLVNHFTSLGYSAIPHARFNIAWGSILSDLDVLLIKGNSLTVIEVKSKHDNIARARRQLRGIADYIDYAYVATDKILKRWDEPKVGLLFVDKKGVKLVVHAKQFTSRPSARSLVALQKKCLLRFLGYRNYNYMRKFNIAEQIRGAGEAKSLRQCLSEVVVCGQRCDLDCPVWNFIAQNSQKPQS